LPGRAGRVRLGGPPQRAARLGRREARCPYTFRRPRRLADRAEPVTLRWVLFHLTEETARHNGHLDILRELADGARGR